MRCIAQFGEYAIQIRPQRGQGMGDGSFNVTQEPIYAQFTPFRDEPTFENELEEATKRFSFNGRYQHVDEATPVDPTYRLSVLDTKKAFPDDEIRGIVEAELRRKAIITTDFFIAEETSIPAPFSTWDTSGKAAYALVALLVDMGGSLQEALDYERLFGSNRPEVVEALEACIADQGVPLEETISA